MERSEGGEGRDTKPGVSAVLAATQNPSSFPPLPSPAPRSPLPSAAGGGRGGGAAGGSRHLPRRGEAPVITYPVG